MIFNEMQVWLEANGRFLPEFEVRTQGNTISCFVPSTEGQSFSVQFKHLNLERYNPNIPSFHRYWDEPEPPEVSLRGNLLLDGSACAAGVIRTTDVRGIKLTGMSNGVGLEREFKFSKLKTTDEEDEACQDFDRLRHLGTIVLKTEYCSIQYETEWQPFQTNMGNDELIYEQSKKAGSHRTALGNVSVVRPKRFYNTVTLPHLPHYEFVFQYASRDWLIAKEIMPQDGALASGSNRRGRSATADDDSSSADSDLHLLDQAEAETYRRLKDKMSNKRKRRRVVKVEPLLIPEGTILKGEVIDLTADSD